MRRPANVSMYHSLVQEATVYAYFAADDVLFGARRVHPSAAFTSAINSSP
jgi:hypothetical protein